MTEPRDHIREMKNAANRAERRMDDGDTDRALDELAAVERRLDEARDMIAGDARVPGE